MAKRILVISHAHPDFSKGGGEVAAYNAYLGFKRLFPESDVRFLAAVNYGVLPGKVVKYKESEYLLGACVEDNRFFRNLSSKLLLQSLTELVDEFQPDYVNFHHYYNIGLDAIVMLRRLLPNARFVMTLHEFLAICLNDGQMIKRNSRSLCADSNEFLCGKCFPEYDLSFFAKRKNALLSVFSMFDKFISPSKFLLDRYVQWGIPADKIVVIENGQYDETEAEHITGETAPQQDIFKKFETRAKPPKADRQPNVFGYFGQINPYKGLDVILMALRQLIRKDEIPDLVVEINGANLETQRGEFKDKIQSLADPLLEAGVLRWNGPYERSELATRMQRIDWVLMPSVWWENSPMIIQESYLHKKPVICSNIGGMQEKVVHGQSGIHVSAGSVTEWAEVLLKASQARQLRDHLVASLPLPPSCLDMAKAYYENS